jgi:hypothetical protein
MVAWSYPCLATLMVLMLPSKFLNNLLQGKSVYAFWDKFSELLPQRPI